MRYVRLITISLFFTHLVYAQNQFTLNECEQMFQKNNLLILAEQFNIDAAKAAVIQAGIWDQPYVSGELNAINPSNNQFFNVGNSGQKTLAIDQLIYLGGKKRKEVDFAKSNVELAELEYGQLIGNLRFELRKSFYEIYYSQEKTRSLNDQLTRLDTLINLYTQQAQKGNVPFKDLVRLQTLSLSIKNEFFEIQKNNAIHQENLKLLIKSESNIVAIISKVAEDKKLENQIVFTEIYLQKSAAENNADVLIAKKIQENNELLLRWQKSLAIPDLTLGANYDQRGGAFNNQVNLTFGIPLPLWNKNRGNVKIAESQWGQSKIQQDYKKDELKAKVSSALNTFNYQQKQYIETMKIFPDFEKVYEGILQNFQKKNISIIEFTDFMESYNQSTLFLNEVKKQVTLSGEMLNYLSNEKVF